MRFSLFGFMEDLANKIKVYVLQYVSYYILQIIIITKQLQVML